MIPLLALGALVYCMVVVGWLVYRLTHPPRRTMGVALAQGRPSDPSELVPARAFTSFQYSFRGSLLAAWDVPGDDERGPICVMTHGFGDSKLGALSRMHAVLPRCSRLIAWDMPGHGEAGGTCNQGASEVLALEGLLSTLPQGSQVVLYGWSLGAGVSLVAAARSEDLRRREGPSGAGGLGGGGVSILGLVLESPYRLAMTPVRNVLRSFGLPTGVFLRAAMWLVDRSSERGLSLQDESFDRVMWAERVRVPVLILHGEADHVSPVADAREIAMACDARLVTIAGGGHFGLWTNGETAGICEDAVAKFATERATVR